MRGLFKRIRTPYKAGSVTDSNAVTPVERPALLFSAFLAFTPTANAAPAIARLPARAFENNRDEPYVVISLTMRGVMTVCMPTITSNGCNALKITIEMPPKLVIHTQKLAKALPIHVPIGPKSSNVNGNMTTERIVGRMIDTIDFGEYLTMYLSIKAMTGTISNAGTMFEVYFTVVIGRPKIFRSATPEMAPVHNASMMKAATYSFVFNLLAAAKATNTGKYV